MSTLGDRIKEYEKVTSPSLLKKVPVMVRVDGKAFHTFTKRCEKPFDRKLMNTMVNSALQVSKEIQGFKVAYIQSDEATFCFTDYDRLETDSWFNYNISKIVSITASLMSIYFHKYWDELANEIPIFDSRAFNVPIHDVVNAFLWRAKDWERNSIQMYARTFFSHKELMNKNRTDIHEMLHSIGKNWATDLTDQEKNGTFIILNERKLETRFDIKPHYEDIKNAFGNMFDWKE